MRAYIVCFMRINRRTAVTDDIRIDSVWSSFEKMQDYIENGEVTKRLVKESDETHFCALSVRSQEMNVGG